MNAQTGRMVGLDPRLARNVMSIRLLIADDNPDDAQLIAFAMKRGGYTVEWQRVDDETGFSRALPGADVVVCDYSMPRFSPVRALEMIRDSGRATPLLLVSGSVSAEIAGRIVALGAAGTLGKDHLDRLAPAVRDALARSPVLAP
jgi:CheY-like chemotaxis protein